MLIHAVKSRHANLKHMTTSPFVSEVNCSECILWLNDKKVSMLILESSEYQHSGLKGVDHKRKLPEWVVLGFESYTTPRYMIRSIIKKENPELYFTKKSYNIVVTHRNLTVKNNDIEKYRAYYDMTVFLLDTLQDRGLNFNYDIKESVLRYRDHEIRALSLNTNLGYCIQYILMIIIGKMANILVEYPQVDKFRLIEQIFSNQRHPRQSNYRCFLKVLLNGDIKNLWENPDSYGDLIPQVLGYDNYEAIMSPKWLSTSLMYKGEVRIIKDGLY